MDVNGQYLIETYQKVDAFLRERMSGLVAHRAALGDLLRDYFAGEDDGVLNITRLVVTQRLLQRCSSIDYSSGDVVLGFGEPVTTDDWTPRPPMETKSTAGTAVAQGSAEVSRDG